MPSNNPLLRYADIIENIERLFSYTNCMSFEAYVADRKTIDAVERCITRLSEAATKLGPQAELDLPHHNWRGIRDIGNLLRHGYDEVVDDRIWYVIVNLLQPLLNDSKELLSKE